MRVVVGHQLLHLVAQPGRANRLVHELAPPVALLEARKKRDHLAAQAHEYVKQLMQRARQVVRAGVGVQVGFERVVLFDHAAPAVPDDGAQRPAVSDAASALQCPKCDRIMTKYRFAADARNHIDLCGHCDEVWLDHGEWEMLERFAMTDKLAHVFTQPWQNRVRSDAAKRRVEDRWREKLGADYEKAREIRAWLSTHPEGKELLAYLYLSQTS